MKLKLFKGFVKLATFFCAVSFLVSAFTLLAQWQYLMSYIFGILSESKSEEISRLLVSIPISAAMTYGYAIVIPWFVELNRDRH